MNPGERVYLQAVYVMHATPDGVLHTPDPLGFVEEHEQELSRCLSTSQLSHCSVFGPSTRVSLVPLHTWMAAEKPSG